MFNLFIYVFLYGSSVLISKLLRFGKTGTKSFVNSLILSNQGNYLIPLLALMFARYSAAYTISIQMIVMMGQLFVLNTFGLYNASGGHVTVKNMIKKMFGMLITYFFLASLILKLFSIPVWKPLLSTMGIIGNSFVTVALLTLGMPGIKHLIPGIPTPVPGTLFLLLIYNKYLLINDKYYGRISLR